MLKKEGNGDQETSDCREIKRIFEVFFSRLYQRKEVNTEDLKRYLDKSNLEKPPDKILQLLNTPIGKKRN